MPNNLTAVEAKWLVDNCMPEHATAEAPGWPPGGFFRKVLGGNMRDNGQLETAYLMLEPGKHLCLKVQELGELPTRYSKTVYHGTSLGALEKIMSEGFRPSVGAGSEAAGQKFGCALPMVYTSGLLETAHGYVGNVDNGQRIGSDERFGPKVNCVIWMQADPKQRLFYKKASKNKSGQLRNEQQGYHPKDLRITKIYLHCIEAGNTSPQKAKYGDGEPNGEQRRRLNADLRAAAALLFTEDQAPWWRPPSIIVQTKKEKAAGSVSKANRRVLKRWKRERANKQATPGSSSAPSKKDDSPTRHEGATSKSAPASGRDHDAHLEGAVKRLAAKEQEERGKLEAAASPPVQKAAKPAPSEQRGAGTTPPMGKGDGPTPPEQMGVVLPPPTEVYSQNSLLTRKSKYGQQKTSEASGETATTEAEAAQNLRATIAALAPAPPLAPPPPPHAAQHQQRSRSPRTRGVDTRGLCNNGCGRPAAMGYVACCRTCTQTSGRSHGPRCNAAFQQSSKESSKARPWRRTGLYDE